MTETGYSASRRENRDSRLSASRPLRRRLDPAVWSWLVLAVDPARIRWTTSAMAAALALCTSLASAAPSDTSQRLAALEKDPKIVELAKEPLTRCHTALDRAQAARAAGDAPQALALEALAGDELEVAQAVIRAVALEVTLASLEHRALDLERQVTQTEILVENSIAMRERRRRMLDELKANRQAAAHPPKTAPAASATPAQTKPAAKPAAKPAPDSAKPAAKPAPDSAKPAAKPAASSKLPGAN